MEKKISAKTEQPKSNFTEAGAKHVRPARPISIPHQLQQPEFRFVLIPSRSKAPCEKAWSTTHNYRFDDPKLTNWLEQGGNYGVCCGFGNLVGIDADDPIIAEVFEQHFGPTFRVRSGSGRGFHDYAIVHGLREKQIFGRNGQHLGEAQYLGQQLVGPGSAHHSGGRYLIVRDVPIVELDAGAFLNGFAGFLKPRINRNMARPDRWLLTRVSDDLQSIPLTSVIGVRGVRCGEEIHGVNPWHGSTTGRNFSLNLGRNVWHCFRCNAGGGVAKAIALNAGIIRRCDDVLSPEAFRRVLEIMRQARFTSRSTTERR